MELLFPDPSYDREDRVSRTRFLQSFSERVADLGGNAFIEDRDLGQGASWPAILASLTGLFYAGSALNSNIDAWIELAKKFRHLVRWLTQRCGICWVDADAANLLAIHEIAKSRKTGISSIELRSSTFIPFIQLPATDPSHLDHHPVGLYVQTYVVNQTSVHTFTIKTNGVIESKSTTPIKVEPHF